MPYEKGKIYKGRLAHKVGEHLSYQGAPRTKAQLYELTKDQIAQLSRNLPGAPIRFEHGKYEDAQQPEVLGQVTHAHLADDDSTLMVEFELNGSTQAYLDQRLIEEGLLKELSLHHDPKDMSVLEVSLVWKGARDNTQIMAAANSPGEPFQSLHPTVAASADAASSSASSSTDTSSHCRTCLQVITVKQEEPPVPVPAATTTDEKSPSTEGKTSAEDTEYRLLYEKIRAEVLREIEAAQVQTPVESKTPQVETAPMELTPTPQAPAAAAPETVAASRNMVSREDAMREMHFSRMSGQRGVNDPTNALNLPPGAPTGFEGVDRQGALMYQQYFQEEEAKRARAAFQQQQQQQQATPPPQQPQTQATPPPPQFVPNGKSEQTNPSPDDEMDTEKAIQMVLGTHTAMSKKERLRIAELLKEKEDKLKEREEALKKQQEELQQWHGREAETKKAMADRVVSFMKATQVVTPEREQQMRHSIDQPGGMELAKSIMASAMAMMKNSGTERSSSSSMDTDSLIDDWDNDPELKARRARLLSSAQPAPARQQMPPPVYHPPGTIAASGASTGWQRTDTYQGPLPLFSRQQASGPLRLYGPSFGGTSNVSDFTLNGGTVKASAGEFNQSGRPVYQRKDSDYVGAGISCHPDGRPIRHGEPGSYGWTFPVGVSGRRFPDKLTPKDAHPWGGQVLTDLVMPRFMQEGYERSRTDCSNGAADFSIIYDKSHPAFYGTGATRVRFT